MDQFEQKLSRFRPAKAEMLKQQILKQATENQPDSLTSFIDWLRNYSVSVHRKMRQKIHWKIQRWKYQAKTILVAGTVGFVLGIFCVGWIFPSPNRLPIEVAEPTETQHVSLTLVRSSLLDESLSKLESPIDWLRLIRQYSNETVNEGVREKHYENNFQQNILLNRMIQQKEI
jgi:hypothetical protein